MDDITRAPALEQRFLTETYASSGALSQYALASRRPIILLGDIGVGKTMFIKRLIQVDAREIFEKRWCCI